MRLQSSIATLSAFIRTLGSKTAPSAQEGQLVVDLNDLNGNPLPLYDTEAINAEQYGLPLVGVNNSATLLRSDIYGGLASSAFQLLFNLFIDGTTLGSKTYTIGTGSMTVATMSTAGITLNSTGAVTAGEYAILRTTRAFALTSRAPIMARFRIKLSEITAGNTITDFGFLCNTGTTSSPTSDGAYWMFNGVMALPVLRNSGITIILGNDIITLLQDNKYYIWDVIKDDESVTFICSDASTGAVINKQKLVHPSGGRIWYQDHAFSYIRTAVQGPGNATVPVTVTVSAWSVMQLDQQMNYSPGEQASILGLSSDIHPLTQFSTYGGLVTPTLSNTTAYINVVDGYFKFNSMAGSATDYIITAFPVPAPYSLKTRTISIQAENLGAAVATTPTQLDFFLRYDSTAASLVNSGYFTKYIGTQTFPVGSAIGSSAVEGKITLDMSSCPVLTGAGKYHTIVVRCTTGTATASQAIAVYICVVGNFE